MTFTGIRKIREMLSWIKPDIKPFLPGLSVIILIQVCGSLMAVGTAIASKNMIDYAVANKLVLAAIAAAVFAGLVFANMLLNVGVSLLSVRILESFSNSMRQRIFQTLLGTAWLPLTKYHSGDLLTRLTSDVNNITNTIVNVLPGIFSLGAQFAASFAALMYFEPSLAIMAFVLAPVSLFFSRHWGRKLKHIQIKVQESESSYRSCIQEALQNFVIIKCFCLEKPNYNRLQSLHEDRLSWIIRKNKLTLAANNVISLGYWLGYLAAFGWGVYRLSQKAISFGTVTAFLQLVQQVQSPLIGLARTYPQFIALIASAERLMILETLEKEKTTEQAAVPDKVGISFQQVSCNYTDGNPVLDRITAEILPGQLAALVGPSGEGKTTLIRLLLALLRPSEGEIYFTDARGGCYEVSAATRDWVTYVPQGNTLFSGSIADNLRSGKQDATPAEMEKAARTACAWGFIEELPQGLDTIIGERGQRLSEGQAQRIAIARAFLKEAPVLILDEATSALDLTTEMNVLKAVKDLSHNCTCLVITHRQSTLKICSRVLRIQNGRLVEENEFNEKEVG